MLGEDSDEGESSEREVKRRESWEEGHSKSDGKDQPLSVKVVHNGGSIRGRGGEGGEPSIQTEQHTPGITLNEKSAGNGLSRVDQGTQTDFEDAGSYCLPPVPAVSASVFHGRPLSGSCCGHWVVQYQLTNNG